MQTTIRVPDESAGARLDQFLVSVIGGLSRSQVQRLIKEGRIRVGGRDSKSNQPVKTGQEIDVDIPEPADAGPQAEALPLRIVYEDRDLIVVDKPAGMVVHPAAGHASGTLVNALLHHVDDLSGIGGEKRPGIVHRLDRCREQGKQVPVGPIDTRGLVQPRRYDSPRFDCRRDSAGFME